MNSQNKLVSMDFVPVVFCKYKRFAN